MKQSRQITTVDGRIHKCGPNFKDITWRVYHCLTVLGFSGVRGESADCMWRCRCVCGKEFDVHGYAMRRGTTKSCGCQRQEFRAPHITTHGHSRGGKLTPEYRTWRAMKNRCYNTKDISYKNYGGRGIKVCKRWLESFEDFLADMGPRPSSAHSIERRENNAGYEPWNCYWLPVSEQHSNKRSNVYLEYGGERLTLAQWSRRVGCDHTSLRRRLSNGWSLEDALTTKPRPARKAINHT